MPLLWGKIINPVKSHPEAIKGYQFLCDNCGACGPIYDNKEDALIGWELGINGIDGRSRKS
jgi:hypothetical protein